MKNLIPVLLLAFGSSAFAQNDGNCTYKPGFEVQENFCKGQTITACSIHDFCKWEKLNKKKLTFVENGKSRTVEVSEEIVHECKSLPGKEVHSDFCTNLSSTACRSHSSLCHWE